LTFLNILGDTGKYKTVLTPQNRILLAKVRRKWLQAYGVKYNRTTFNMSNSKGTGAIDLARVEKRERGTNVNVSAPKFYNILLSADLNMANTVISATLKANTVFGVGGYKVGKATQSKKVG